MSNQELRGPEWLTVEEAQDLARVGRSTLYKYLDLGTFKSVSLQRPGTIRGRRLVSRASILAHLEGLISQGTIA
jgi:hypothetical protein